MFLNIPIVPFYKTDGDIIAKNMYECINCFDSPLFFRHEITGV